MSFNSSGILRLRLNDEIVFQYPTKQVFNSPRQDKAGNLYVCSKSGEIVKFNSSGEFSVCMSLSGLPSCLAFEVSEDQENCNEDPTLFQNKIYFTDMSNRIIYSKTRPNPDDIEVIVKDYEGYQLKGPTSLCITTSNDNDILSKMILFCDAGSFSETNLSRPNGSVFSIDLETQILNPVLFNCLSYPSDIYYDKVNQVFYVTEMFNNRVLKIVENPKKVFHASVFHIFNGRLGPSSICCDDDGYVYVSRYEEQNNNPPTNDLGDNQNDNSVDGLISVLNKEGNLIGEIYIPKMSEITGIFITNSPSKNESELEIQTNKNLGDQKNINDNNENDNVNNELVSNKNLNNLNNNLGEVNNNKGDCELYFTERRFNGVKKIKLIQFKQELNKLFY